jgi:hypothetical protein
MLSLRWCCVALAIATLTAGCASSLQPHEVAAPAVQHFEIAIAVGPHGVALESHGGTTWGSTSWAGGSDHGCRFFVGRNGVASHNDALQLSGFCLEVETSGQEVQITSVRGTTWQSCNYAPRNSDTCRFVVTENGIRGL